MTFDQYTINPMGIKNAVYSHRQMYRDLYTDKYNKLLLRELGKIEYQLFYDKERYFIYFKIPSEVVPKFYYDVVVEFYTDESIIANSNSIKDYYVKFYSNDPSFVFTFAYAFRKNDLFIKELSKDMSKEALKTKAVEKNPKMQVGYVKSLYFAYLTMKRYSLFYKVKFKSEGDKINFNDLLSRIEPADEKIRKRQELGEQVAKEKREKKQAKKTTPPNRLSNTSHENPFTSSVKTTKRTRTVGNITSKNKKSKSIKFTKKI